MKIWLLKRAGANNALNMFHYSSELTYPDGSKTAAHLCFYRRKDAVKHCQALEYGERCEVVSATVQPSTRGNRKRV